MASGLVKALAYDGSGSPLRGVGEHGPGGSLLLASFSAVYRLPLGAPPGYVAGAPELIAGSEVNAGYVDGRAQDARFHDIIGMTVDGRGRVFVADMDLNEAAAIRRIDPNGTVATVARGLVVGPRALAVLPGGYLAVCGKGSVHVLDLGLELPRWQVPAADALPPACPPRRTLQCDLGALLDRQPDGTSDLEVLVGDRAFPVHRVLLAARCDYFRQRLGGGFADGDAARLSLPDADADAFAAVLRFLYTGAADVPPARAQAVAELADRLLLPELCAAAQARVLADVTAEGVVAAMLWAEGRGPGFEALLDDLKAWYLEHYEEVRRHAAPSLKRLMAERPDLMLELMDGLRGGRGAKAQRTR